MQPNDNQNPYYPAREDDQSPQGVVQPQGLPQSAQQQQNQQPFQQKPGIPSLNAGNVPNSVSYNSKSRAPLGWIATTIILSVSAIALLVFAMWAYGGRQDFKNNVDQKVGSAVETAKKQQTDDDNKRFAEELKNPLKTYTGPSDYGSVVVQYPKTWSSFLANNGLSSGAILNAYFHPDIIPPLSTNENNRNAIALNVQVLNQSYSQAISGLKQRADQTNTSLVAEPYALPKMPSQSGILFRGQITNNLNGIVIYIPLRDKTIRISTDTDQFLADFNNYILPNFSFEP